MFVGANYVKSWMKEETRSFYIRRPFVDVVGSFANWGKTFGDIDVLLFADDMGTLMPQIINCLCEIFGPTYASRVQFLPNDYQTPFTCYVELFDLKAVPHQLTRELAKVQPYHREGVPLYLEDFLSRIRSITVSSPFIYRAPIKDGKFPVYIKALIPQNLRIPIEFRIYRTAPRELWPLFEFEYGVKIPKDPYVPWFDLVMEARKEQVVVQMAFRRKILGIRLPSGSNYVQVLLEGRPAGFVSRRYFEKNIGVPLALVTGESAFGVVQVLPGQKVGSLEEIQGWICDKLRDEFAGERDFWYYGLLLLEAFDKPMKVEGLERGERLWLGEVELIDQVGAESIVVTRSVEQEAERAKAEDKITLFEFFYPLKSAVAALHAYRRAEV